MIKTTSDNKIKRVLWTGGFDSTYRMIELALQDVIVEPVYVVNPGRRSRHIELSAMNKMLELLRGERESLEIGESEPANDERCACGRSCANDERCACGRSCANNERCASENSIDNDECCADERSLNSAKRFKADIREIRTFNKEDIVIPDNIHAAYERLHASHDIGPQYEWLSALSKNVSDLEICIEAAPTGRLHSRDVIIVAQNDAANIEEPALSELIGVAGGNSTFRDDVDIIFGDFILPIFDITEEEMIANIRKWGCEDIIKHVWFCNHPLRGGARSENKEQGDTNALRGELDGVNREVNALCGELEPCGNNAHGENGNKEQGDANALRGENDALRGELDGVNRDVNALCGGLEPCGICHPCRIKAEAGMVELLPSSALGRYRQMRAIEDALGEDAAREYRMKIWVEFGIK